jgi:ATP-binding cassette, subfamily B, bacterial
MLDRMRQAARLSWQAVQLVWRASHRLMLGLLALLVAGALLPLLQLALSKAVIDRAALDLGLEGRPGLAAWAPLGTWIALAAVVFAAVALLQVFLTTLERLIADRLTAYISERLLRAANRWPGLTHFEDATFLDDLERARGHAARSGLDLVMYGGRAGLTVLSLIGLVVVLTGLHPAIPFLLIAATVPQTARQWEFRHRTGSHLYAQTPEARRLEYNRDVLLEPESAKDVRLFALGPFFARRYETNFARTTLSLDHLRMRLLRNATAASALAAFAAGAIYLYLVWLVVHGQRTLGDLVLYGGAVTMLQAKLLSLGFDIGFLALPLGFLPSLFRVLEAEPDLALPANPTAVPRPIRQGFVFEDVGFCYPGSTRPVLEGLSFRLRPGERVALVGHNGAGKTTIVKLLSRLYDPTAGRILLDGVDLRDYDLQDLRRELAVLGQDFMRYQLTAGENIGLGRPEAVADSTLVWAAAERSGAKDLVAKLPDGLATRLGRQFGGIELSEGEWQKLALGRVLMRPCQVLVLDEPTAALDAQAEHDLYVRLQDLSHEQTTLLISHRFSTVRMADRIVCVSDGHLEEEGTHGQLLQRNGWYAHAYRLQAARYVDLDAGSGTVGR